jgi:hypothetical protein
MDNVFLNILIYYLYFSDLKWNSYGFSKFAAISGISIYSTTFHTRGYPSYRHRQVGLGDTSTATRALTSQNVDWALISSPASQSTAATTLWCTRDCETRLNRTKASGWAVWGRRPQFLVIGASPTASPSGCKLWWPMRRRSRAWNDELRGSEGR